MNKKNIKYLKFGIDLLMASTFVLFFNKRVFGGLTFHEIAGLSIAVVFFTHILLNWQWVKNITLKLFNRKIPFRTKFSYLLNLLLLVGMAFIMMSGIFISRVVFPNIYIENEQWFKIAHMSISFLVLIIVAIHIGLHWKWIINVFKNIVKIKKSKRSFQVAARVATVALLIFGSYEIYSTNFLMHLEGITKIFNPSSNMEGKGFNTGERHDSAHEGFAESGKPDLPAEGDFGANGKPSLSDDVENGDRSASLKGNFHGGKGQFESASALGVIIKYFAIMSVFIILIYYIEKSILHIRRRQNLQGSM